MHDLRSKGQNDCDNRLLVETSVVLGSKVRGKGYGRGSLCSLNTAKLNMGRVVDRYDCDEAAALEQAAPAD